VSGEGVSVGEGVGVGVGVGEGVGGGVGDGVGGGGQSLPLRQKMSTVFEYPLLFCPPPKKILFVDEVAASE
jgi:hypothetical protein